MSYPTDVTDAQWALLEPVLGRGSRGPLAAEQADRVNAIPYQARTGCQWRYPSAGFGRWNTIWKTFCRWRDRGVWQQAMDVLLRTLRVRAGRDPEPPMVLVDGRTTVHRPLVVVRERACSDRGRREERPLP